MWKIFHISFGNEIYVTRAGVKVYPFSHTISFLCTFLYTKKYYCSMLWLIAFIDWNSNRLNILYVVYFINWIYKKLWFLLAMFWFKI